jgi:hypothetical protein
MPHTHVLHYVLIMNYQASNYYSKYCYERVSCLFFKNIQIDKLECDFPRHVLRYVLKMHVVCIQNRTSVHVVAAAHHQLSKSMDNHTFRRRGHA